MVGSQLIQPLSTNSQLRKDFVISMATGEGGTEGGRREEEGRKRRRGGEVRTTHLKTGGHRPHAHGGTKGAFFATKGGKLSLLVRTEGRGSPT